MKKKLEKSFIVSSLAAMSAQGFKRPEEKLQNAQDYMEMVSPEHRASLGTSVSTAGLSLHPTGSWGHLYAVHVACSNGKAYTDPV